MQLVIDDPSLIHYNYSISARYGRFLQKKSEIEEVEGSLADFALGYKKFGIHKTSTGIIYREWAPGAHALCLVIPT